MTTICSICLESEFSDEEFYDNYKYITPCAHIFHKKCLKQWCAKNNSCPSCRTKNVMFFDLAISLPPSPILFSASPLYHDLSSNSPLTATTDHDSGYYRYIYYDLDNNNIYNENNRNLNYNSNNISNDIINNISNNISNDSISERFMNIVNRFRTQINTS